MEWWYRLYGWSHTRSFAPVRVGLLIFPVYLVGQFPPIILKKLENSLTGPQDIMVGFFLGTTLVLIFETLLTLGAPKYAQIKEREACSGAGWSPPEMQQIRR